MRGTAVLAIVGLTGCDLVLDLGRVDPSTVTGTVVTRRAAFGGSPLALSVTDSPARPMLLLDTDGNPTVALDVDNTGGFSFDHFATDYRLDVVRANQQFELQDDVPDLHLVLPFAGRGDAPAVTSQIPITINNLAGGNQHRLASIGQWTSSQVTAATFDWQQATPIGNVPLGLLDSARGDRLIYMEFNGAITKLFEPAGLDMVATPSVNILDVVDPTNPRCITFDATVNTAVTNLTAATQGLPGYDGLVRQFRVESVPTEKLGELGAIELANQPQSSLDSTATISYFDPFDIGTLATAEATLDRKFVLNANDSVGIQAVVRLSTIPADTSDPCSGAKTTLDTVIAIPRDITLARQPLIDDATTIALDRGTPEVAEWQTTDGAVDYFDVELFEVSAVQNTTILIPRRAYRTRKPSVEIQDDVLEPNRHYVLQVTAVLGYPGAATGDYATLQYPIGIGSNVSSMFEVQ